MGEREQCVVVVCIHETKLVRYFFLSQDMIKFNKNPDKHLSYSLLLSLFL